MRSFLIVPLGLHLFLGNSVATTTSTKFCPLLGPAYPKPSGLSSNTKFQAATADFDASLTAVLETGMSVNGPGRFNATTISIGMFSTLEDGLLYQRHYTDPVVASGDVGTQKVDADSVYRLGSIGKVMTVYMFLIREGDQRFNDPITKYIPQLAVAVASNGSSSNAGTPNWNEITIGQLASHISGLGQNYGATDFSYPWQILAGLPPIPENQVPKCSYYEANGTFKKCTGEGKSKSRTRFSNVITNSITEYVEGMLTETAVFQSSYTPIYSNNAFVLLGLALQNITGYTLEEIFNESLVKALDLTSTTFDVPSTFHNGVIPGDATRSSWDSKLGPFAAAGGFFSSTNEIAKIGIAILNSTLLSKEQTRRWMKPVTLTASLNACVGVPWEIYRTEVAGRIVDIYIKDGGIGAYSTILGLVPDYDFGFSILTASINGDSETTPYAYTIANMISEALLPVLEQIGKDQAEANFAGHYYSSSSNINSSMTIAVDNQAILRVTDWISNGTDMLTALGKPGPGQITDFRIQPNQLYTENQIGFTGTWARFPVPVYAGPMDFNCIAWGGAGSVTVGNIGIEQMLFEMDPTTGTATSIQLKALRTSLKRQIEKND